MCVPSFHLLKQTQHRHGQLPAFEGRLQSIMSDVRDGAVVPDVDVKPGRHEVLSHHRAWWDDPVWLGQVTLRKRLL